MRSNFEVVTSVSQNDDGDLSVQTSEIIVPDYSQEITKLKKVIEGQTELLTEMKDNLVGLFGAFQELYNVQVVMMNSMEGSGQKIVARKDVSFNTKSPYEPKKTPRANFR